MPGRKRIEQPHWKPLQCSVAPECKSRILMFGAEHNMSIAEVVMYAVDIALPRQFGKPPARKRAKAAVELAS